jgi:hypothetical protein
MSSTRNKKIISVVMGKARAARRLYQLAALFSLFDKSDLTAGTPDKAAQLDEEANRYSRIRCPLCSWQPNDKSRWVCSTCAHPEYFQPGCGRIWNTFNTRGLCPGCQHQWRWTICLYCQGWSLHESWYLEEAEK